MRRAHYSDGTVNHNATALLEQEAAAFYRSAIDLVESDSIRAWAETAPNRPLLIQLADAILAKQGSKAEPHMLATLILSSAIGL